MSKIKVVAYPPSRGLRFAANLTTGEVHDMTRVRADCEVRKIKRRADSNSLDELIKKLRDKFNACGKCMDKK
jgi:hypothetical protein